MKIFNIRDVIIKQVNLEAEMEHANDPQPKLPKYKKSPKAKKDMTFWLVFFKTQLYQLAP